MITTANLEQFKVLASEIRAIAVQWQARLAPFLPPPDHVIGMGRDPEEAYTDETVHAEIQAITTKASIDLLVQDLDNYLAGRGFGTRKATADSRWDPDTRTWKPA